MQYLYSGKKSSTSGDVPLQAKDRILYRSDYNDIKPNTENDDHGYSALDDIQLNGTGQRTSGYKYRSDVSDKPYEPLSTNRDSPSMLRSTVPPGYAGLRKVPAIPNDEDVATSDNHASDTPYLSIIK